MSHESQTTKVMFGQQHVLVGDMYFDESLSRKVDLVLKVAPTAVVTFNKYVCGLS